MSKCPIKRPRTRSEKKEIKKSWNQNHKYEHNIKSLEWYHENKDSLRDVKRNRNYLYNHGIAIEEVKLILKSQDDKCAICEKLIFVSGQTGAHVDHCHNSNIIRGILCQKCNQGLGLFNENINFLLNAISYLKKKKFILIVSPFEKAAV